jgi:hypothetical protein
MTHSPYNEDALRERLISEIHAALDLLPEKRDGATYRQLVMSLTDIFDKVQLLDNLPPIVLEVAPLLREIVVLCTAQGWSFTDLIARMLAELHRMEAGTPLPHPLSLGKLTNSPTNGATHAR